MIVAGLPILPAGLAIEPPALLPDPGQAGETSAGSVIPAAGDVPGEWLAALQAALVGAARAETEPLPGEPAQDVEPDSASRRSRALRAEEEPGVGLPEADEPVAARLAPVVWDGFEASLDPVPPVSRSDQGEEAGDIATIPSARESVAAPAETLAAAPVPEWAANGSARPGGGSEAALLKEERVPVGRAPELEPSRAPAPEAAPDPAQAPPIKLRQPEPRSLTPEAAPLRRAREQELAFRAKITQRPISLATAVPPETAKPAEEAAEAAPQLEPPRQACSAAGPREQDKSGNPVEEVVPAARPAPPERARMAAPGRPAPPTDRIGRHALEPLGQDQAPAAGAASAAKQAAPRAEATAATGREPAGAARAARVGPPAPVAAELAPRPAALPGAATETVKRPAPAGGVPPEAATLSAPMREPARRIELRLGETAEAGVSLQVVDRGGRLEVAVRTPDHDLAGSLRQALPDLVRRMEQVGFRTETWAPDGAQARTAEPTEPARVAADLPDAREGGRNPGGGEAGRERQEARERRAQLEPGDGAAESEKEKERWAVWLWR